MNTNQNSGQWSVVSDQLTDDNDASRGSNLQPPASRLLSFPLTTDHRPLTTTLTPDHWPLTTTLAPDHWPLTTTRLPRRAPRGVLLLVVLSLLVLFTLIGVTFILVASQSRRATRADSRHEQHGDDPQRVVDAVFGQIVRDTTNPRSSLQGHSLLADMYGNDGVKGTIAAAPLPTPIAGGQMFDITTAGALANLPGALYPTPLQMQALGYFNGCVLTMVDGPAANLSARIIGWGYSAPNFTIRVVAFEWPNAQAAASFQTATAVGNAFVINGRPFNGTGFGFNAANGDVSANSTFNTLLPTNIPFALFPNGVYFPKSGAPGYNALYPLFGGIGGGDEDYDAADPQNLLLGYMPISPTGPLDMLPSLHRPDLIRFLTAPTSPYFAAWNDPTFSPAILRRAMLRPMGPTTMTIDGAALPFLATTPVDHPNFTGSNPTFDAVRGPWDVDNDGDGVADSVWVDIGLPVQTAPDGRRFKPLAAILCLDLDGRLNVNAHGSLANVDASFAAPGNAFGMPPNARYTSTTYASAPPPVVGLGQGYGPADVSLAGLFPSIATYQSLMTGDAFGHEGRYGVTTVGLPFPAFPGINNAESPMSLLKHFEYPVADYPPGVPNYPNVLTAFGNPPDLWCRGFTGLDVRGTPLMPGTGIAGDTLNNPYDFNLNHKTIRAARSTGGVDNPFSPAELEAILRVYDVDSRVLPDRLRVLLGVGLPPAKLSHLVTTDSFDLPSPSILADTETRAAYPGTSASQNLIDLMLKRNSALTGAQIAALLPGELVAGLRMDLNRPFGNGRDDNNNGVVDEPLEADPTTPEYVWFSPRGPVAPGTPAAISNFSLIRFDHNNDGVYTVDDMRARQLFARHLYVLMQLLRPPGVQLDFDGIPGNNTPAETARGLAQWAVNVVDFRDRDSIMTPFEYVLDPFTALGWTPDGDITTPGANEGVVWGCERPELLIAETLAFHDRRTEDSGNDDGGPAGHKQYMFSPPGNQDPDFDQRLVPLGSLFVELYNPWATQTSSTSVSGYPGVTEVPGEFYDVKTPNVTGVLLNRRSLDPATGNQNPNGSPVWRLLVVKGPFVGLTNERREPEDPTTPATASFPPAAPDDVERSIYFVDTTVCTVPLQFDGQQYYSNQPINPLLPGRYAVVGSAGYPVAGSYVTPIGRPTAGFTEALADYSACRRIVLTPGAAPGTNEVKIFNNGSTEPNPIEGASAPPANVQPAIAVVINHAVGESPLQSRSISISEPTIGYPPTAGTVGVEPVYPTRDHPLDEALAVTPNLAIVGLPNGTQSNFRTIHLQRLANPQVDWNRTTNPYLTIDTMSVDLTIFNGVYTGPAIEPAIPAPAAPPLAGFASLQRGDNDPLNASGVQNNLWRHEIPNVAPVSTQSILGGSNVYNFFLQHTLGYLNKFMPSPVLSNASINAFTSANPHGPQYTGSPNLLPFPWLTWNDRPYVGPLELMLVPKGRSARLLYEYNYNATVAPNYTFPGPPPATQVSSGLGHSLSFFQTAAAGAFAPHFYRVFEYLNVPSRFVGTETVLNPSPAVPGFNPPFNKVSNYREPGRININTIPNDGASPGTSPVWTGILNGHPGPAFQSIIASRRGYGAAALPEFQAASTWPGYFSNPFRSASGAPLTLSTLTGNLPRREVDVTLLRADDPGTTSENPLFAYISPNPIDNSTRNPYYRYQTLQRLSNLLTTRSNVYAVWVTVGYFEVSPAPVPVDPIIYPDGFQLGQEIGSETGEIKRPRAFYIYDRSIPVGFEPGKDHNIEQGTLIKRFIE